MILQRGRLVSKISSVHAECFLSGETSHSFCQKQRSTIVQSYIDDISTLAMTHANPTRNVARESLSHHSACLSSFGRQAISLTDATRVVQEKNVDVPSVSFHSPNIVSLVKNFTKVVESVNGESLCENLYDGAQPMTASRQAKFFYELFLKAAGEGVLLQAALLE